MGIRDFIFGTMEPKTTPAQHVEEKATVIDAKDLIRVLGIEDAGKLNTNYEFKRDAKEVLRNPIARKCLTAVTQAAQQPRWELYFGEHEVEVLPAAPLAGVFAFITRPNEKQTLKAFLAEYLAHLYLAGEAFIEMFPDPISFKNGAGKLYLISPDRVTFDKGDYVIDGKRRVPMVDKSGKRTIIHIREFALFSERGQSVLGSAWTSIVNHNMALKFNSSILNNSARMSIVANYRQTSDSRTTLDKEQLKDLNNDIDRFASPEGRGKPLVVSGDWDFKEFGQSNKDLDWLNGMESMARNIALAFGVDPVLLSFPGDSTYNNKRESNAALFKQVAMPRLEELIEALEHWFREYIPGDWELKINLDDVSSLEVERESLWDRAGGQAVLTNNERRELIGYEPLEEVDEPEEPADEEEPIEEETEKETNDE